MKKRKYILFVFLLLLLPLSVAFNGGAVSGEESRVLLGAPERVTVLCAGLDEAAGNTDVLMLVTLDSSNKEISVLQIPRDTYLSSETVQSKINQLYPTYRAKGDSKTDAMARLAKELTAVFGVTIDHYVALDFSAIAYLVDSLGGLVVNVPSDVPTGDGGRIYAGERCLSGEEALAFLRYRAGYIEGDLARVDAQKLLLVSAYKKIKNELSLTDFVLLIPDLHKRITTDMTVSRQISLAYAYVRDRAGYTIRFMTLPGQATRADENAGVWYYVASRRAATEMLKRYFSGGDFDKDFRLTDTGHKHFTDIYESESISYSVYTEESIDKLEIKTK